MRKYIYQPPATDTPMTIACFVSGTGTNYERIAEKSPRHNYIVFTNRPGCEGAVKAAGLGHSVVELSHLPFLAPAREHYGSSIVPRNCPERVAYEKEALKRVEAAAGRQPDLICLAGYDQWVTDWMVDAYYPRILNVHPGDTVKGYDGLHWVPSARAIIAGDTSLRSTLFLVDKGEDTGPVLMQSQPLDIIETLGRIESEAAGKLLKSYEKLTGFITSHRITSYRQFRQTASEEEASLLKSICIKLQSELKVRGDWEIYPFGVHDLIASGRVEIDGRIIFVDGQQLPAAGYPLS